MNNTAVNTFVHVFIDISTNYYWLYTQEWDSSWDKCIFYYSFSKQLYEFILLPKVYESSGCAISLTTFSTVSPFNFS